MTSRQNLQNRHTTLAAGRSIGSRSFGEFWIGAPASGAAAGLSTPPRLTPLHPSMTDSAGRRFQLFWRAVHTAGPHRLFFRQRRISEQSSTRIPHSASTTNLIRTCPPILPNVEAILACRCTCLEQDIDHLGCSKHCKLAPGTKMHPGQSSSSYSSMGFSCVAA